MTVKIEAPKIVLQESIRTISSVIRGDDEDMPMDLNLTAAPDGDVELYVRKFNNLQVLHRISSGNGIELNIDHHEEFVFSSQILESLIQSSDSERMDLEFGVNEFKVFMDNEWFSEPAEFKLPLFQDSEFQNPIELEEFYQITSVECKQLRSTLNMMNTISPVFEVSLDSDSLEMSVQDAVQGQGEIIKDVDPVSELPDTSSEFEIRPVEAFLKHMSSDKMVNIQMSVNGNIMIQSELENWTSQLVLTKRVS